MVQEPESESEAHNSSFERAVKQLEEERKLAEEKADYMRRKAAMGNTPAF